MKESKKSIELRTDESKKAKTTEATSTLSTPTNIRIESLKDYEDIRSVKHHLQFSPKKPKINTNAPTELGKESLDQGKSPKGLKFADLKVYSNI